MALLVLFSTMSFTVDKHFCGDYLVDQSLFSEAESCGMEHYPGMSGEKGCKDESVSVEGQDELSSAFSQLDLEEQVFLQNFTYSYLGAFEEHGPRPIPFKDYSPPTLVKDILLLDQVFLI